jgi:nucleotide-binding universal stress UspA family protein
MLAGSIPVVAWGMNLPKTIMVPTDFSEHADHALEYAVALAAKLGAKVHIMSAITIPSYGVPELGVALTSAVIDTQLSAATAKLDKLASQYLPMKIDLLLRTGDARDMIAQAASEIGADLIVMGTHGRRGVSRALLGSVAEGVVRTAPCPVLTIRKHKEVS